MQQTGPSIDVAEADFEREVLERSRDAAVVVDFWAPWCGPCRALSPLLDRLAEEHAGDFRLAKVNVDEAPTLAQRLGIRSIPTVLGFRDGVPVAEFTGAQPEAVVRQFLQALLPTPADRLAREGEAQAASGDDARAEQAFREALARDGRQAHALLGLARLLAGRGEDEAALELLERISPSATVVGEADRLAAELRTRQGADADEAALRARVEADAEDLAARVGLAHVLAGSRSYEPALQQLLEVVRRDPEYDEQSARKAMLDIFAMLGDDHPLTQRFRGELARALFR